MDRLPIRVKLDFSSLDAVDYSCVWHPVARRQQDRIADFKNGVCAKYDLNYDLVDLFLRGALLREEDTILILREDDHIEVMCKPENLNNVSESRKKKRKSKICDASPAVQNDTPEVSDISTLARHVEIINGNGYLGDSGAFQLSNGLNLESEVLSCFPFNGYADDYQIPKKKKKKKNKDQHKEEPSSASAARKMHDADSFNLMEGSTPDISVINTSPLNNTESNASASEIPLQNLSEHGAKTNGNSNTQETNQSKISFTTGNSTVSPKKKRKRHRKRKNQVCNSRAEIMNIFNKIVEVPIEVPNEVVEKKNKHIRFDDDENNLVSSLNKNSKNMSSSLNSNSCSSFGHNSSTHEVVKATLEDQDASVPPELSVKTVKKFKNKLNGNVMKSTVEEISQVFDPNRCNEVSTESSQNLIDSSSSSVSVKNKEDSALKSLASSEESAGRPEPPAVPTKPQSYLVVDGHDSCPQLHTVPPIGTIIAFKLLELSDLYCPEVSDFKEGVVVAYDDNTDFITVQLHVEEIKKRRIGKFENIYESDEDNEKFNVVKSITVKWTDLLDVRKLLAPCM